MIDRRKHLLIKNDCFKLEYELDKGGHYFVHLQVYKWSKQLYKDMLVVWGGWMNELNQAGVRAVFITIPDNDPKLYKFEQMFGFEEICRKDGAVLMAHTTGR